MSISKKFYSPEDIEQRNSETTTNENEEMQKYEKRILQCILAEKIIPMDLKYWPFFHFLKAEFIQQIHMVVLYGKYETSRGAVIVTKDKNVYNIDCNKDFRSMTGHVHISSYAKKIKELCGKNIRTFAHSWSIVLALTEEGEVYIYKFSRKPGLDQKQPDVPTFTRIDSLNKRIVEIACGNYYFLALTSDGEVYVWSNYMLDDNKDIAIFNRRVRQVKRRLKNKNVVHIACGHKFNMVITDENKLYGWGNNEDGQISTIQSQKQYVYPHEITTFSENKIVKIVCGFCHTLALTNKGELYAWGDNFFGQLGINNNRKPSGPIMVNVPQMGKVLNVEAYGNMSIAVGYDRTIYVWGLYFSQKITQPCPTKFSRIFDVFVHSMWTRPNKPLIVHDSLHTVRITNNYNYKYTEKILNILESLKAAFDDPLTSDLTIQVEGLSIYVHKAIIKIRCQYFFDRISDSFPVCTISDKFSYVVYKAFLKYLYTSTIDLPLENTLELMELAEMYCHTNLKKDCSQIIKQTITMSNVVFFYSKAIEYNAKELEEFCFQFMSRHMTDDTLSEDYNKLDISFQAKCKPKAAIENNAITPSTFYSSNKNIQKYTNSETSINKNEMQKCEKRILQCILAEKITSMGLKRWPFFHLLKSEFIPEIRMVMLYGDCRFKAIIVTKDKNVYILDYKEQHLKTGDTHTGFSLKEIKELCGKYIKTFAYRYSFMLVLTDEGEVYFCKITENPHLSRKFSYASPFSRVVLSDKRIVNIGCGRHYGLALTSDGKVYEWEKENWEKKIRRKNYWKESDSEENDSEENDSEENDSEESDSEESDSEESDSEENVSQVDIENTAYFNVKWQVKHELEKEKVVLIVCGLTFNIVVTDENTIYGWGDNRDGQISIVQSQKYYKHPHKIITIPDKIVKVVCGDRHTLALTSKGEVYAWGDNNCGQTGVNNNRKSCGPTMINVPEMRKVLDIAAYRNVSVAIGYNRIIYVWGQFFLECCTSIPFPTKFSNIYDAFAHSLWRIRHNSLITFTNNFNVEEVFGTLESLRAIFDDPLTSDFTIRVKGRPIYVHKAILTIRCQYFKNMFQHDWIENIQSTSKYIISNKFSYVVYKAFLKYLYTGIIDLPSENALELMELADMYCEANLIKDCSQKIKKIITVSNVIFFYNKAIEYNVKDLEEFCFHFAVYHMKDVVLSREYIKLDTSTKDNFMRRAAKGNIFRI